MVDWMERTSPLSRWSLRLIVLIIALLMLFPFFYVVIVSFASLKDTLSGLPLILPFHPNLDSYQWVLQQGGLSQGFLISAFVTTVGTAICMFFTTTMAYALSQRNFPGRKFILWAVLLTLLIIPSIITKYLVVRQLNLLDTLLALVLPSAVNPFNLIVLRQFFMNLPVEVIESAKLDGANDLQILWRIVLPLSKPALAAITLFYAVANWNSWFEALLYINNSQLYPITILLRQIVLQGSIPPDAASATVGVNPPDITIAMAMIVLTTLPILCVYPFLQRYFTQGVLTGAIKG
jgi:putative aldouronate transport system permease protein